MLPMVRGYPMTFGISQEFINRQFALLAQTGIFPSHWHAVDGSWTLDAEINAPYIDFGDTFKNSIRLNIPVKRGTFTGQVANPRTHQPESEVHDLTGMVFRFVTPMSELDDETFYESDLNAKTLYIDLESPSINTIVETSKAVTTHNFDRMAVPLKQQITTYVQTLARNNKQLFTLTTTALPEKSVQKQAGGLQPTSARYSVYEDIDKNYSDGDPKRSARSSINWLLILPWTVAPTSTEAGSFDQNPLGSQDDAVMVISGYAIIRCIVLPMMARAFGVDVSRFTGSNSYDSSCPPFRLNGSVGPIQSVTIYPSGDKIQIEYYYYRQVKVEEKVLGVLPESVTITTEAAWSTYISFYVHQNILHASAKNTKPKVKSSSSSSFLGIEMPSFINSLVDDLANIDHLTVATPSLQNISDQYARNIRALGGKTFELRNAQMKDGNLYMGLKGCDYTLFSSLGSLRSISSDESVGLNFRNIFDDTIKIAWVNYQGQIENSFDIANGQTHSGTTYITHVFVIYNKNSEIMAVCRIDSDNEGDDSIDLYIDADIRSRTTAPPT